MMRFNKLSCELSKLDEVCFFTFSSNSVDDDFYLSYVSAFIQFTSTGYRIIFVPDEFLVAFKERFHKELVNEDICELIF